ncbi:MAG: hypothetical protein HN736_08520 [Anaerolineae bacterium]|jgi:hypothetical protein|nr:hypothetical protein [Anaerolineae bacterium]MBT3712680.1 hypothetical protein [Anaerolineae bacterium]MBT4309734.1 hypothetical protein [Anaerolineae bacterium]MBT4457955.1 hypothetical protein [Anaerolineae bacterium]MBT4841369.1 hypothetical protein [Anaerolineae bacterium]
MRSRFALDLNLLGIGQHFLGVDAISFTPRRCLGTARKPKSTRVAVLFPIKNPAGSHYPLEKNLRDDI